MLRKMILVVFLLALGFTARHARDTWLSPWRYETRPQSATFIHADGTETTVHGELNLAFPTGVSKHWAQWAELVRITAFMAAPTLLLVFWLQFALKQPELQDELDYA